MAQRESALAKLPLGAKIGISAFLFILTGAGYFVIFYNELASDIRKAHARTARLQTELASAKQAEFAYQKDLAELTDRQQRQRELNKILPPDAQMPQFLDSVQNVANVAAVSLQAYVPEAQQADRYFARVPMKLKLEGRYHQIAKFFYEMGQLDRVINMEDISMRFQERQNDTVSVKVSALATAFRAKNKAEAQPAAAGRRRRK